MRSRDRSTTNNWLKGRRVARDGARRLTRRAMALAPILALVLGAVVPAAHGATEMPLHITKVDASEHPIVRVGLIGGEHPDTGEIRHLGITENGEHNTTGNVYPGPIGHVARAQGATVILAIDTSLSMGPAGVDAAMQAARRVLDHVHGGDQVGVVTFDDRVQVLVEPTADISRVEAALSAPPELKYGTALYDALRVASHQFRNDTSRRRVIVLLSDGADVGSTATEEQAAAAPLDAGVQLVAVGIADAGRGGAALRRIVEHSNGAYHSSTGFADLSELYDELAVQLLRTHWLEYHSSQPKGADLDLVLTADGQAPAEASVVLPPPVKRPTAAARARTAAAAAISSQARMPRAVVWMPSGAWAPVLAALPFGLLASLMFALAARRRRRLRLEALVRSCSEAPRPVAADAGSGQPPRVLELLRTYGARQARSASGEQPSTIATLQRMLEQANVPLVPRELLTMSTLVGMGACAALAALTRSLPLALLAGIAGAALAPAIVALIAQRRRRAFEEQMPDSLAAIGSALRAGHGLEQAIAAMAADAPEPTGSEFQRALEETRLGRSIEDAIEGIADRWQSADFNFVVTTVAIQRQVGGSLAEILNIVATTVRQRQIFRRKVHALTSMGRMSVWVLMGLPVVIAAGVSVLDPNFLDPLLHTRTGHMMIAGAAVSMAIGATLCRRIVNIRL